MNQYWSSEATGPVVLTAKQRRSFRDKIKTAGSPESIQPSLIQKDLTFEENKLADKKTECMTAIMCSTYICAKPYKYQKCLIK